MVELVQHGEKAFFVGYMLARVGSQKKRRSRTVLNGTEQTIFKNPDIRGDARPCTPALAARIAEMREEINTMSDKETKVPQP